jgi:3-deoxy-D-manno-octulosonic-acid transferase
VRFLYSVALYLALPALFMRLAWRGLRSPGYRRRWMERLGYVAPLPADGRTVWVHAVSVGEVQAALPLVHALGTRRPDCRILVTTTTPTGSVRVRQVVGPGTAHAYLPYDLPDAVARFLDRVRPAVGIVMETELWPNLVAGCERRAIPLVLANARLSERSARGYARVGALTRQMLAGISAIAAQSAEDAARLIALGASADCVHVTGSIKFDVPVSAATVEQGRALRGRWGAGRGVLIAASTHEGEEEHILDAFARIVARVPDCLLVLVPRHPERFEAVAALARRRGFATVRRTAEPADCSIVDIYVGDTMGELAAFYAGSDVAFVGGSLVPVGGHNVLEPAALGVPVVHGPHCFNFAEITRQLDDVGAAVQVADGQDLAATVCELLTDADRRHRMGELGREFVERSRGARERLVDILEYHLPRGPGR